MTPKLDNDGRGTARATGETKDPSYRRDLIRLGRFFARGEFAALLAAADDFLRRFPDNAMARRARAAALLRLARPAEAAETLAEGAILPRDAEAASLLGLALFQCGKLEPALEALARARRIDRRYAPAWANLGSVLAARGDRAAAARAFGRSLALDPSLADARSDYGRMLLDAGQAQRALEILKPAFSPQGQPVALHLLLARACASLNDRASELAAANAAVVAAPRSADARIAFGAALQASRHYEAALAQFRRAGRLQPGDVRAAAGMAETLRKMTRLGAAQAVLTRALKRHPGAAILEGARANLLYQRRDFTGALSAAGAALAAAPRDAGAHFLMGSILLRANRRDEARASYEEGLALNDRDAGGWNGMGLAHFEEGCLREAVRAFNKGLKVQPNHPTCLFSLGLMALILGDWATGWPLYEWRWLGSSISLDLPRPEVPGVAWWAGESLAGKRLLVLGEQGFGDNFQFARLLSLLPGPAAVVYAVADPLQSLMRQSLTDLPFPIEVIGVSQIPQARVDAFITLMSIPARVGLTLDTLPPFKPWLRADPDRLEKWRDRIGADGFKIGICWQGSPHIAGRLFRLEEFQRIARIPGVRLISLHKGEGERQLRKRPRGMTVESLGDDFDSGGAFLDTAAVMEQLDLVISCDTSVAHLAGGLGRPTWIALKHVPDFRWMLNRADSPWYPSARLFRQKTDGDWGRVFEEIERALVETISSKAKTGSDSR